MATAEVESAPPPPPALPEYLLNPNAVLKDDSKWRYGKAPDYSNTRTVYEKTKKMTHAAASLPSLVENLVKNWEIEASFKPNLSDWRTIDHANYSFAINGGPPQTAEHMLKVGTYNAIIASNEFYSPANSSFASSHKTFKRMMPTFAWEVIEVYSGPPTVAFRWRHWGQMKNDYVGFNDKGEKITAKAHQGPIEIEGVTVAHVDEQVRLQKVETWFDPLEMFRQIAPKGIVNKEVRSTSEGQDDDDEHDDHGPEESAPATENGDAKSVPEGSEGPKEEKSEAADKKEETEKKQAEGLEETQEKGTDDGGIHSLTKDFDQKSTLLDSEDKTNKSPGNEETAPPPPAQPESSSSAAPAPADPAPADPAPTDPDPAPTSPLPNNNDDDSSIPPASAPAGSATATAPSSTETQRVHEELSRVTPGGCPFLNQE